MRTPLRAPASGTVTSVIRNSSGGLQVVIRHDNGYTTGYAHLDTTSVAQGARVNQGDYFAHTGNSGASTGPHLHLTMRNPAGQRIAPSTLLYTS